MKQQKLNGYQPNYPKKAIRGVALAAAALMAIGSTTGCRMLRPQIMGDVAVDDPMSGIEETLPPEELQTEGMVAIDEMETPEPPMTPGTPVLEPTPEPEEEPMLMGDVAVFEP